MCIQIVLLLFLIPILSYILKKIVDKNICNMRHLDWTRKYKCIPVRKGNLIFQNNLLWLSEVTVMDSMFSKYCFLITPEKVIALRKANADVQTFDYGQMPERLKKHFDRCKEC